MGRRGLASLALLAACTSAPPEAPTPSPPAHGGETASRPNEPAHRAPTPTEPACLPPSAPPPCEARATSAPTRVLDHVARVRLGGNHSCAVMTDHTVRCWGANLFGQLGIGSREASSSPVVVPGLADVSDLALGGGHTCALRTNGTVACFGNNETGQLGDGTTEHRDRFVEVAVPPVVELTAGWNHTCGRTQEGAVWCWGDDAHGQLGGGNPCVPQPWANELGTSAYIACSWPARSSAARVHTISDAIELHAGTTYTCARRASGELSCWGRVAHGLIVEQAPDHSVPFPVGAQVTSLTGHASWACGLDASGATCFTVDTNSVGARLGIPRRTTALAAAGGTFCALQRDGALSCSVRTDTATAPFARVALPPVSQVVVEDLHACAVTRSGALYCWGNNLSGQVGAAFFSCGPPSEPDERSELEDPPRCAPTVLGPGPEWTPPFADVARD